MEYYLNQDTLSRPCAYNIHKILVLYTGTKWLDLSKEQETTRHKLV